MLDENMKNDELRLHMGELNANELLVARAAIGWANSDASKDIFRIIKQNSEIIVGYHEQSCKSIRLIYSLAILAACELLYILIMILR